MGSISWGKELAPSGRVHECFSSTLRSVKDKRLSLFLWGPLLLPKGCSGGCLQKLPEGMACCWDPGSKWRLREQLPRVLTFCRALGATERCVSREGSESSFNQSIFLSSIPTLIYSFNQSHSHAKQHGLSLSYADSFT